MLKIFFTFIILMSFESTFATTIKVKKVKGKQAIIESSGTLKEGETYEVSGNDELSIDSPQSLNKQDRKNSLNLGVNFTSIKSGSTQEVSYDLSGLYGWNAQNMEFGPTFSYASSDVGAGATSTLLIGGFFDYNLVNNKFPEQIIYGPTAAASMGQIQFANSSSASLMNLEAGFCVKYFLFKLPVALRGELNYAIKQVSTSGAKSDLSGFVGRGYLSFYF